MPRGVYPRTAQHRRNIAVALTGKKLGAEHRRSMAKAMLAYHADNPPGTCRCHSGEASAKRVTAHTGRTRRPGTGERISSGLRSSPKRAAYNAAQRGHIVTEATRRKIGLAHKGRVFTEEHLARMREAGRRRQQRPDQHEKAIQSLAKGRQIKGPTSLERALACLLTSAGFSFEEQTQRGVYHVDAWVPSRRLVFEADGAYWHQNQRKEAARDAYLLRGGAAAVIHLTEEDLQPWLP